jgi:two-component system, OmpR family, KDP operon response regulator KdpE
MYMVLVVEDDAGIRGILRTLLETQQFRVVEAETGTRGIEARGHRPDLVIVDLGLPDRDGQSVICEVRKFSPVPILVLSARTLEHEKVAALDAGADDYVAKPFSAPELLARVRAALRRAARVGPTLPVLKFGPVTVDLTTRTAQTPDRSVHLTPLEFRVIECLARNAGMIVTQKQLIREVWGPDRLGRYPRVALLYQAAAAETGNRFPTAALSDHRSRRRISLERRRERFVKAARSLRISR